MLVRRLHEYQGVDPSDSYELTSLLTIRLYVDPSDSTSQQQQMEEEHVEEARRHRIEEMRLQVNTCHLCLGYAWAMFGLCSGYVWAMFAGAATCR